MATGFTVIGLIASVGCYLDLSAKCEMPVTPATLTTSQKIEGA
jgi:hypothetical protein